MFVHSLISQAHRCRQALTKALGGSSARRRDPATRTPTHLEDRKLLAAVVGGNLQIAGSNGIDNVLVDDVTVSGRSMIRVNHNGYTQYFNRTSVPGEIQFWGYGGNDSFDYVGTKDCYLDGGTGNDYLSGDAGWDYILGGYGHDTLEGWAGNDDLYGGSGNDLLDGGSGHDWLFGQSGNDLLGGGAGDDLLNGGSGYDVAFGGSGFDDFEEVGNDPGGWLYYPITTRFGVQYRSAGVQDFNSYDDVVWS